MSPFDIFAVLLIVCLGVALWFNVNQREREQKEMREKLSNLSNSIDEQVDKARGERNRLLNALTDAFLLIESDGHIRFANHAAHELLATQSLVNRTLREAFHDPRLIQALKEGVSSGKPVKTRIILPQQASPLRGQENRGMNAWIVDVAPLPKSPGMPGLSRVIIRDITPEHQTEQIRKDFVANASHELRTPMAIIHGYLENLIDDEMLKDEEMSRKFLMVMRKHSDRISRIIDDMLVISRLESGEESSLNIEPFDLRECLQDILDRLESVIRSQQVKVQLKLSEGNNQICGDHFYWTQTLFNLIENAMKQNPRPGLSVEIGSRVVGDRLEIWVSDDGIGIPSADLPFVFRRFYRVEKHHSQSEVKGTGLGLSIVKRAIEAHQGTITATSTPGTETKFLISVPLEGPKTSDLPIEASLTGGKD